MVNLNLCKFPSLKMRDLSDAVHFSWFSQMTCKPILHLSISPCLDVLFRKQKLGRSALFVCPSTFPRLFKQLSSGSSRYKTRPITLNSSIFRRKRTDILKHDHMARQTNIKAHLLCENKADVPISNSYSFWPQT